MKRNARCRESEDTAKGRIFDENTGSYNSHKRATYIRLPRAQAGIINLTELEDFANRYSFVPKNESESFRRWKDGERNNLTFNLLWKT